MRSKLNKILLTTSLSLGVIVPSVFFGVSAIKNNIGSDLTSLTRNSHNVYASNDPSYLVNINGDNPNKSSIKQYYAYSSTGDSYAILTNSSNNQIQANQITKYSLTGSESGKSNWVIKASDIESNATIVGINYASGSLTTSDLLYVLYKVNNTTKLATYNWDNGQKVGNTYDLNSKDYNFIVVANGESNNVILLKIDEITTSNKANYLIDFLKLDTTNTSNQTSTSISIPNYVIENHKMTNNFVNQILYKNGNILVAFQNEKIKSNESIASVLKIELDSKNNLINSTINFNQIISYTLTSEQINKLTNDSTYFINLIDMGNSNDFSILLRAKYSTNNTNYLVLNFSLTNFNFNGFINDKYPGQGYIQQIRNYYVNDGKQSGFIGLDSTNKVFLFDQKLNFSQQLVDFQSQNKVYNISTIYGNTSWFPQNDSGSIANYYNSTFINALDGSAQQAQKEILVDYDFLTNNDLNPSVKYRLVSNNGSTLSPSFQNFLNSESSYKYFLNISYSDTRFPEPKIKIEAGNITNNNRVYTIPLTFKQTLREKQSNGTIVDTSTVVNLGTYNYKFINADSTIEQITDKNLISNNVLNLLPSQITSDDVLNYLFKIKNVDGIKLVLNPDDINGVLNVIMNIGYAWVDGTLKSNIVYEFNFGSIGNPFFKSDQLASYDTSIKFVDQNYYDEHAAENDMKMLNVKYSTLLPSEISKQDYLNDFVILGSAFNSIILINSGKIVPPTENDVTITPIDNEGIAIIELVIPKVGDKQNIRYSFNTAKVFKKNIYANNTFYFNFKSNDEVLETEITPGVYYKSIRPSQLLVLLQGKTGIELRNNLMKFANFSNYFGNLLMKQNSLGQNYVTVVASANDYAKTFNITINFLEPVPGLESQSFSKTFNNFWQGNEGLEISSTESLFEFGKIKNENLRQKPPNQIKITDLEIEGIFIYGGSARALEREIKIRPINISGSLEVTVTFKNWIEKNSYLNKNVIVPVKVFSIIYNEFLPSKDPINMVVWKSYDELDNQYKGNILPSDVISQVESTYSDNIDKLMVFAKLNEELEILLRDEPERLEIDIAYDNKLGTITILARIKVEEKIEVVSTTISGFSFSVTDFGIIMTDNNNPILEEVKSKLPSQLTDDDISKFYKIPVGNWLEKTIDVDYNDIYGELTLIIKLYDSNKNELAESKSLYTGFKTNSPNYQGTNWFFFVVSTLLPILLVLTPIFVIKFWIDKKNIRKFSRKLNQRVIEENKKPKTRNVNSIKDLIED